jgi:uncharacterized protein (TIGR02285 family)
MYQVSLRYFGITFLIIMTCNIQAKEAMNWSVTHWPPLLILKGENAGNGRYDVFLKYFEQQMPQYTHQSIDTNWTRVWRDIKAGKKICNMLALKNSERQDIALFSKPAGITLSNRIIMRESTYKQLGQPQKMALTELFNHPHLKGVIESSRSYTPVLDSLIKNKLQASNLEARKTNSVQLLKMLLMKRFDYMIEYPYIADYLYRGTPQTPVTILTWSTKFRQPS